MKKAKGLVNSFGLFLIIAMSQVNFLPIVTAGSGNSAPEGVVTITLDASEGNSVYVKCDEGNLFRLPDEDGTADVLYCIRTLGPAGEEVD